MPTVSKRCTQLRLLPLLPFWALGCGDGPGSIGGPGPIGQAAVEVAVIATNAHSSMIHILLPEEEPIPAPPPTGTQLDPGRSRELSLLVNRSVAVTLRAVRGGVELHQQTCTVEVTADRRYLVRWNGVTLECAGDVT